MKLKLDRQDFVEWLTNEIDRRTREVTAFQKKVQNLQPREVASLLEWSNDEFRHAAELEVYNYVLKQLQKDPSLEQAAEVILRYALNGARSPKHSTSVPANLIAAYITAAWAEMAYELIDV